MSKEKTYISFDWALKKLLRQKANFGILEGFLSVLLKEDIKIKSIKHPEANKGEEVLKFNRVDILIEDEQQRLVAVELQYNRKIDYFYRILFATSQVSTDHIKKGYDYSVIKKVYNINLLYFELIATYLYLFCILEKQKMGLLVQNFQRLTSHQVFLLVHNHQLSQKFDVVQKN